MSEELAYENALLKKEISEFREFADLEQGAYKEALAEAEVQTCSALEAVAVAKANATAAIEAAETKASAFIAAAEARAAEAALAADAQASKTVAAAADIATKAVVTAAEAKAAEEVAKMRASLMEREEELQSEIGLMEVRNCARKGMGPDCLTPATTTLSSGCHEPIAERRLKSKKRAR